VPAPRKYPSELRERAQRLVAEAREQDPDLSLEAAVKRIGPAGGRQPRHPARLVQAGRHRRRTHPGTTTSDAATTKRLQAENRELKRANEILFGGQLVLRAGAVRHEALCVSRGGERPLPLGRRSGLMKLGAA
jgi:transposase